MFSSCTEPDVAQIFKPASQIQRVSNQQEAFVKVFYGESGISSTLTTIHTVPTEPQGCRDVVTFATFYVASNIDLPFSVTIFVESRSTGLAYEIAQANLLALNDQWRPFSPGFGLPLGPGDKLQIIGSGAGAPSSISVDVYIGGIEYRPAT